MGGTMDYARFRNRNGLGTILRPPLSEPSPYAGVPGDKYMLAGDLNRMERDVLGLNSAGNDIEVRRAVAATGIDREVVLRVLRFHLDWPEPGCDDCGEPGGEQWPKPPRCSKHRGLEISQ